MSESKLNLINLSYGKISPLEYINELSEINMRFYKEKCVFRGHDAYKILILENDIDLESLLKLL